jgi:O-antigen biosynthesis protein
VSERQHVSLVTLNWSHYDDLTGPFIRYVDAWTADPKELIVVDQGSGEHDREALQVDAVKYPWLNVILLEQNVGFPAGCNVGTREAIASGADAIIWINNDIVIYGEWLPQVLQELERNDKALVGAALVSRGGGWNEYDIPGHGKYCIPYLEGWLLAAKATHVYDIGYFDEQFGKGSLEDVDLCWRALRLGFKLIEVPNLPLKHLRGRTVMDGRIDQLEITYRNYDLMKAKVAKTLAEEQR